MSQTQQESSFNLLYIFQVIRKYLIYIIGVVALAGILAIIFTLPQIYKPEYLSSTIVYPTSAERYDVVNLFHDEPILYLYGESKEVEKLEHLANSEAVKMFIIDSLNLWDVYGVHPENDESPKYYVLRTYNSMVNTVRVAGNGLQIEAYDINPDRAAAIVNLLVQKVDEMNINMLRQNKASIHSMYRKGYENLEVQLAEYTDSLRRVRKRYNVFNAETQTERMVEQVMLAEAALSEARTEEKILSMTSRSGNSMLEEAKIRTQGARNKVYGMVNAKSGTNLNLETFREGLDQVLALEEICEYLARDIKDAREKIEVFDLMDMEAFTTILVTEEAQPSDKKARPVRWVILLATLLIAGLASIMGAVLVNGITGRLDTKTEEAAA